MYVDEPSPEGSGSRLLSLAPELRNRIYRFTLLERDQIEIEAGVSIPLPPSLLQTCRQIRQEASGIYYEESRFRFTIHDYDATLHVRWTKCFRSKTRTRHSKIWVRFRNQPMNWANLLVWLEHGFRKECGLQVLPNCNIIPPHHFFEITKHLRDEAKVSWEVAKPALEHANKAIALADPKWA